MVHCAGVYYNKDFEHTTTKNWDECMNINTRSIVHITSLAVPFLETSKGNKSVVVLTADNKEKPLFGEILFSISKVNRQLGPSLTINLVNGEHVH